MSKTDQTTDKITRVDNLVKLGISIFTLLALIFGIWAGVRKRNPPDCLVIKTITANPEIVQFGGTSNISVIVDNPEGLALTYIWSASNGTVPAGSQPLSEIQYVAPNYAVIDSISVVVKSTDCSSTGKISISITP